MNTNSIQEIRQLVRHVMVGLHEFDGYENVKLYKNEIGWILRNGNWLTLCYVQITEYSPEIIRFRNNMVHSLPKSFWPFAFPKTLKFELTVHHSEIDKSFIKILREFIIHITANNKEKYLWDLFADNQSYPSYAWSKKACDVYQAKRKQDRK